MNLWNTFLHKISSTVLERLDILPPDKIFIHDKWDFSIVLHAWTRLDSCSKRLYQDYHAWKWKLERRTLLHCCLFVGLEKETLKSGTNHGKSGGKREEWIPKTLDKFFYLWRQTLAPSTGKQVTTRQARVWLTRRQQLPAYDCTYCKCKSVATGGTVQDCTADDWQ